ncbi:MAG: type II toxin-antitoxin system Phd/YefM family antitoxin [Gemmatimonadaceae bacterium]
MPHTFALWDIRPLTTFRANAASFVEQVQSSNEAIVLTQRGVGCAVLLSLDSYMKLQEEVTLLRDVRASEEQVASGKGAEHEQVATRLRATLGR